jgi:hypothetical protein
MQGDSRQTGSALALRSGCAGLQQCCSSETAWYSVITYQYTGYNEKQTVRWYPLLAFGVAQVYSGGFSE